MLKFAGFLLMGLIFLLSTFDKTWCDETWIRVTQDGFFSFEPFESRDKKAGTIRIGMIKANAQLWNLQANWELFETLALRAKERGAQIICTHETFLDGYAGYAVHFKDEFTEEHLRSIAQTLDGDNYLKKAKDFAREHSVHLVFGFTELAENGCYNSVALIDDKGVLLGCYHKIQCLPVYLTGGIPPVWETKFGKIGIMICADRRWPEVARTLRVKGAELIFVPTFGMWHLDNEWWVRTRSYENEAFICFTL